MKKRTTVILISIFIISIIGLNIYTYTKYYDISQHTEHAKTDAQNMVLISEFRTEINKMSQYQKLYLVTSKESYKKEYEEQQKSVYETIISMEKEGVITSDEKDALSKSVYEYNQLNLQSMESGTKGEISAGLENQIIKANNAQLSILGQIDNSLDISNTDISNDTNQIESTSKLLKTGVQGASTVIAGLASTTVYLLKKNNSKLGDIAECIVDNIEDELKDKEENDKKDDKKDNKQNNKKEDKQNDSTEEINNCSNILEKIDLIYNQSYKMKYKIDEKNELVNQIDSSLERLRLKIEESEECSPGVKSAILRSIREDFMELIVLFEVLPIYNEVIMELSKSLIENEDKF